jgi:hypothetical protein
MKKNIFEYTLLTKNNEYFEERNKNENDLSIFQDMISENSINLKDIKQIFIKEWVSFDDFKTAEENEVFLFNKNLFIKRGF